MQTFKNEQEIYDKVLNEGISKVEDVLMLDTEEMIFDSGHWSEKTYYNANKTKILRVAVDAGWPYIFSDDLAVVA